MLVYQLDVALRVYICYYHVAKLLPLTIVIGSVGQPLVNKDLLT